MKRRRQMRMKILERMKRGRKMRMRQMQRRLV
jgi:hypothetical protein